MSTMLISSNVKNGKATQSVRINRMIVHHVEKHQHDKESLKITYRDKTLKINDIAKKFIEDLDKTYYKSTSKSHGRFHPNNGTDSFEEYLKQYLQKNENDAFIIWTKKSAELFSRILEKKTAATGGYLFFIDYIDSRHQRIFAVIILNNKEAYSLNPETLELLENISLSVDKLDMASLIKLEKWQDEDNEDNYLSFSQGRKQIREYFINFIGCEKYQNNNIATRLILESLETYCKDQEFDESLKLSIFHSIFNYFDKAHKDKEEVYLDSISSIINPDNPISFCDYLNDNCIEISSSFHPSQLIYKSLVRYRYENKDLILDFSKDLVNDGTIIFENKKVIIEDELENIKSAVYKNE